MRLEMEKTKRRMPTTVRFAVVLLLAFTIQIPARAQIGQSFGTHILFIRSVKENANFTQVTLPLFRGTSHGQTVWHVITDSSDRADAAVRGVNFAPKLANAKGTAAVQRVLIVNGEIVFPATVDFSPNRVIVPGPTGFPPVVALPGAVGEPGYSPLIEMPDGTVLNAPQIARGDGPFDLQNRTNVANKVISIDTTARFVTYVETPGFYDNRTVHYASFDSSSAVAAAIEDVTYAPNLAFAPTLGDESHGSAREGLIAFTNGQTGGTNPERQGLSSALLDHLSPLNTLHEVPSGKDDPSFPVYSPLWDVRLAMWTPAAITNGLNTRQTDFGTELLLVAEGFVTGPGGVAFGPAGFIVNCPAVSLDAVK